MARTRTEKHLPFQRALGALFIAAIVVSMYGAKTSAVATALARGERVPVLLFGIDAADASRHTDTILVTVLDPMGKNLSLLSLPRDTRVDIPGYLFRRVNEIYGYHYRKSGDRVYSANKVLEAIDHIMSSEDTPVRVPYFIQIDFSGFTKMVDLIGGVWVNIKIPMHYDDNAGNYHFHKEPGRYLMRGQEALHYVRFRGATGDRGRILRQQEFLRNMAKRMANPMLVLKFPRMVTAITSSVITNLSFWDMVYFTSYCRKIRSKNLGFFIMPGRPRGPYWVLNKESVQHLSAKLILGRPSEDDAFLVIAPQEERITVNVWNASGQRGLAYKVTKFLRQCGYDVVDWGNYPAEQLQTRIIDRNGELYKAKEVAGSLGVDDFHSEFNPKRLVDVEVVLGQNYSGVAGN